MNGCLSCKFYKSELGDFINGRFISIRTCKLGNEAEMNNWWKANGNKTDNFDTMSCYEPTDTRKSLIELIESVERLTEIVNSKLKTEI